MAITNETYRAQYNGTGTKTSFDYTWLIYAKDELEVVKRDASGSESVLVEGSDYTVTGVADDSGGTVELTSAPASGETLVIVRNSPLTQLTELVESGKFPSDTIEKMVDRAIMLIQQLQEQLDRTIKLNVTDTVTTGTFPSPEADKLLGWNSAATAIENKDDASASASAAATSASEAAASAASINLPSITASDEDASLEVKSDGSGYDLIPFKERVIRAEIYNYLFI